MQLMILLSPGHGPIPEDVQLLELYNDDEVLVFNLIVSFWRLNHLIIISDC